MLKAYFDAQSIEAGCDEAGRGCLAGPVVAAAVILPKDFYHPLLNDSKQISEKDRAFLRPIIEKQALAFAVSFVDNQKIDEINILNASILAMQNAVDMLKIKPKLLLIDGNRFKKHKNYQHQTIIKGDSIYASIAAASVLAKTYRDDFMENIHLAYPQYAWHKNKAYPTKKHREAIKEFGITPYHRLSYKLLKE
jgi:ribonuclease HII